MVDVPGAMPVITPEVTVALDISLLLHDETATVGLEIVIVEPTHTLRGPGSAGAAFIVTTTDLVQALVAVYTTFDVPGVNPVTTPVALIVPAAVLLLLHVPPVVALLNEVVVFIQIFVVPLNAPGEALTVATIVRVQPVVADV
jgi:hypothetical protein